MATRSLKYNVNIISAFECTAVFLQFICFFSPLQVCALLCGPVVWFHQDQQQSSLPASHNHPWCSQLWQQGKLSTLYQGLPGHDTHLCFWCLVSTFDIVSVICFTDMAVYGDISCKHHRQWQMSQWQNVVQPIGLLIWLFIILYDLLSL